MPNGGMNTWRAINSKISKELSAKQLM